MNRISVAVFGLFVLLSYRDIFSTNYAGQGETNLPLKGHEIPSDPTIQNTVKIQFCQQCGYRQAFEQRQKFLMQQFPSLRVIGEIHQPNLIKTQIISFLSISKILAIVLIFFEYNPFAYLNIETPRIWTYATQHKGYAAIIIILFSNLIESNLMSTGAFEIFYNDVPIWSKLATGRVPDIPELLQIVQSQTSAFNLQKNMGGEFFRKTEV